MENNQFQKTLGLIDKDTFSKMKDRRIFIAGLGGVGGTVFEALVRTGFCNFYLVDFDYVSITNLNRQILYTHEDLNRSKVEVAKERGLKINPKAIIETKNIKISYNTIKEIPLKDFDIIIDCIDDTTAKILLAKYSQEFSVKYISSMGMANKCDPNKISMMKLNKTSNDPLARKLRYEFKINGIDISKIECVASTEEPTIKGSELFSLMSVTSVAGLILSSYVISYFKEI